MKFRTGYYKLIILPGHVMYSSRVAIIEVLYDDGMGVYIKEPYKHQLL